MDAADLIGQSTKLEAEVTQLLLKMVEQDSSTRFFGFKILEARPGFCKMIVTITPQMTNAVGVAHGGICFSLADSCCGIAINLHGRKCVSTETTISQFKPAYPGQAITAHCKEEFLGDKIAVYTAEIFGPDNTRIAMFKGSYYRSSKAW